MDLEAVINVRNLYAGALDSRCWDLFNALATRRDGIFQVRWPAAIWSERFE